MLGLLAFSEDRLDELATSEDLSLREPNQAIETRRSIQALKTAYEAARDTTTEEVMADLRAVVTSDERTPEVERGLARLPELLAPKKTFDRREAFSRERALSMPQLDS